MDYSKFFKSIVLVMSTMVLVGCGSSGTSGVYLKTSTETEAISSDSFDTETGAVTEDTTISVGDDKDTETKIEVSEGTQFTDENGDVVTKAPTAKVEVEKKQDESTTELDFSVDGKKVIPTEPITVSVQAPEGAKAGDEVEIEVPEGIKPANMQKLILVIVNADGTVSINIMPYVFRNHTVIAIIVKIKKDDSTN